MKVAVLPGDGIGPEITAAALRVIRTVTDRIEFLNGDAGLECYKKNGEYLPRGTMDIIDECDAVLFGTVSDPTDDPGYRSPLVVMHKQLDIFTTMKPFCRLSAEDGADMDAILVSENAAGVSSMTEMEGLDGAVAEVRTSTVGCKRLCQMGRRIAESNNRKNITLAHNGDHMKASKDLLIKEFTEAMKGSSVTAGEMPYVDVVRILMTAPERLDVIIATDLRRELLDSVMGTAAGRAGNVPVCGISETKGIFRPDHGAMQPLAGTNKADPTAAILAGGLMLEFLGLKAEGKMIKNAVRTAYGDGRRPGTAGTEGFADQVASLCRMP